MFFQFICIFQALIDGLAINRTLEWLDIRETDITTNQYNKIRQCLQRNRRIGREDEEGEEGEDEYEEEEVEQQADSSSINASSSTQKTVETSSAIDQINI